MVIAYLPILRPEMEVSLVHFLYFQVASVTLIISPCLEVLYCQAAVNDDNQGNTSKGIVP